MAKGSAENMIGVRFARWQVIGRAPNRGGSAVWDCRCDCGVVKAVYGQNLRRGLSRSCGCLHREMTGDRVRTHGMAKSPIYAIWNGMVQRVCNPDQTRRTFPYYQDIDIDPRWLKFENFYADMGDKPTNFASLERRDNLKGYWKDNVEWADDIVQANNRSSNVSIEYKGETRTLTEWCRHLDMSHTAVHLRINRRGWSPDRALSTPTKRKFVEKARAVLDGSLLK